MKKDKTTEQTEQTESLEQTEPIVPLEPEIAGVPEPELREPQSYFYEPQELVAQPFLPEPKEDNDFEIPLMPPEQPQEPQDIKESKESNKSKGSKESKGSNKSNPEDPGQLFVPKQQQPQSSKIILMSTPTNTTTLFEVMARKQRKELNSIEL